MNNFAKPGDGLPKFERIFIKRVLVPSVRLLFSWNIALFLVKQEVKTIQKLVQNVNPSDVTKQVKIQRTFAIEDHSRTFSINMVLEHLVIAGSAVQKVIETLSREKEFTPEIKIENVKPRQNKQNQLDEFVEFYNDYFTFLANLPKKQSKATKAHPWFVAFNNYDWSVFMFMHTFIHRRQIQAILKELA
jgi:hypothetical protein